MNDMWPPDKEAEVPGNSLFQQAWWLDAVAPGAWGEVRKEHKGQIVARLPYVWRKHRGLTQLRMPPLTQTLGPWLRPHPGKYPGQLAAERELLAELIEGLPPFHFFDQHFHHSITNWLPFYWRGFEQTTRYTYVISDLQDLDAIWQGMDEKARRDVRRAERSLAVRDDLGVDECYRLCEMTFQRQGRTPGFERELLSRIDHACAQRGCRRILFAEDAKGQLHAVVYIVWDSQTAYYLLGGGHPELRKSGAASLLLWEAIRFAAGVTRSFDFEGSVVEPIWDFFRSFGARQVPYMAVWKTNSLSLRIRKDVRKWWAMARGK